jgi:hypothetical protein
MQKLGFFLGRAIGANFHLFDTLFHFLPTTDSHSFHQLPDETEIRKKICFKLGLAI